MSDIVDAHHHIWRQADLPWLTGPMQPRIFGPYEPIRRDYSIQEYLGDLAGSGVTRKSRLAWYSESGWCARAGGGAALIRLRGGGGRRAIRFQT